MENEFELDLDNIESNAEKKVEYKNRFQKLSEKVFITSKEKEEALAKAQAAEDARLKAEKERDFFKDFSTNVSKYPSASEYQDRIFEKVGAGYSTEDAILAVLAKEGKLNFSSTQQNNQSQVQVEGGSAATSFEGQKSVKDMKPEEKFAALVEAEKSGDLLQALLGRN